MRLRLPIQPRLPHPGDAWRLVRVALRTGLVSAAVRPGWPAALGVALRHGLSVRDVHALHARVTPDRPCLVDAHRTVTWRAFDDEVNRLAHGLARRLGVGPETPLVLLTENRVETVAAWMAGLRLGARVIHASWRATPDELAFLLDHASARVVLASAWSRDTAEEVASRRPEVRLVTLGGGTAASTDYADLVAQGAPVWPQRSGPGGSVVYTSGTTGRPKGATRDFARLGLDELARILDRLPLKAGERHLLVAPLDHSAGQGFLLLQAALGGTTWLLPRFDAETTLRTLSREAIHSVFLVPTMIRRLLDLPEAVHAAWPTPALRVVVSGAAPFPHALRERAIARYGAGVVHDFYGATELGWVTLVDGHEMGRHPGTLGRPLAGQALRIVDDAGRPLPPEAVGRVQVRTHQRMEGYLGDPEASRSVRQGRWSTVEDLGWLDRAGRLYLAGRARDLVISGGLNVYPAEIEAALAAHPGVAEVAVWGEPDPDWGERLVAAVVPQTSDWNPTGLSDWLRARLAPYKVPKRWVRVAALPRTATGKVRKRALAEALEAGP